MKQDKTYRPIAPFARALKAMREAHGLSQHQIARIAGCNVAFVCSVENSLRPPFAYRLLSNILSGVEGITKEESRLLCDTAKDENPKAYPVPCDVMLYLNRNQSVLDGLRKKAYKRG